MFMCQCMQLNPEFNWNYHYKNWTVQIFASFFFFFSNEIVEKKQDCVRPYKEIAFNFQACAHKTDWQLAPLQKN